MASDFNPDAYLAQKAPASGGFDPDAYLAEKSSPSPVNQSAPTDAQQVPGTFPAQMEHDAWTQAIAAHPNDYYAAKKQVLDARNKYTQSRTPDSLAQNLQGASGIVAGTAMAPLGMAQEGLKNAGQSLEDKYPGISTSLLGGALKMSGYAIPASPKQLAGNEAAGATIGYGLNKFGSAVNPMIEKAGQFLKDRLPERLSHFNGVPEEMTRYVQGRGSGNVFTPENLTPGSAIANVEGATAYIAAAKAAKGEAVGAAEDKVLEKVGSKSAGVRHIREGLEKALFSRGLTDPKTAPLARAKELGVLNRLVEVLTPTEKMVSNDAGLGVTKIPVSEKLTLQQAVNAKRLIDSQLDFADKELSTSTEQLLKKANHQIRVSVRSDLGPGVSKLWDEFGAIADAQDKLKEFTGTTAKSNVQQRAVSSLKSIMLRNPKEVDSIVKILGAGLPGGEAQARQIFDSIAAESFSTSGRGAPSSTPLKIAAWLGLTGGTASRAAIRASESLGGTGFLPQGAEAKYLPEASKDLWYRSALPKMKGAKIGAALRALYNSRDSNGQ